MTDIAYQRQPREWLLRGGHCMFQRRHYEVVADTIKRMDGLVPDRTEADALNVARATVADRFASMFATDNPRFDRARFLRACGMDN